MKPCWFPNEIHEKHRPNVCPNLYVSILNSKRPKGPLQLSGNDQIVSFGCFLQNAFGLKTLYLLKSTKYVSYEHRPMGDLSQRRRLQSQHQKKPNPAVTRLSLQTLVCKLLAFSFSEWHTLVFQSYLSREDRIFQPPNTCCFTQGLF